MKRRKLSPALGIALALIALVWAAGAGWSFAEQRQFAADLGFEVPWLLPAVLDGLPVAMACMAFSASLDGRPAVATRLGTALAVAVSVASNAAHAWTRTSGDLRAVIVGGAIPFLAGIAFEVLLGELRKRELHRRGRPVPVPVPTLRPIRLLLDPWSAWTGWRRAVLDATAPVPAAAPEAGQPARDLPAPPGGLGEGIDPIGQLRAICVAGDAHPPHPDVDRDDAASAERLDIAVEAYEHLRGDGEVTRTAWLAEFRRRGGRVQSEDITGLWADTQARGAALGNTARHG